MVRCVLIRLGFSCIKVTLNIVPVCLLRIWRACVLRSRNSIMVNRNLIYHTTVRGLTMPTYYGNTEVLSSYEETISAYLHRANKQESAIILSLPIVAIVNVVNDISFGLSRLECTLCLSVVLQSCRRTIRVSSCFVVGGHFLFLSLDLHSMRGRGRARRRAKAA